MFLCLYLSDSLPVSVCPASVQCVKNVGACTTTRPYEGICSVLGYLRELWYLLLLLTVVTTTARERDSIIYCTGPGV